MSDNNDFLKGYKDKSEGEQKPAPDSPETNKEMAFKEESTFQRPARNYSPPNNYRNDTDYGRKRKTKNLIAISLSVFSVLLIILTIAILSSNKVDVPDFMGWKSNDFMLWASENDVLIQVDEQYNDNVEEGIIFSQSIPAGSKIKKNEFIKVSVSKGADLSVELELPDIMNMTLSQIEEWEEFNHMSKIRVTSQYDDLIPLGNVIEYEINDNTVVDKVKRDTPIYIVVSKGQEAQKAKDVIIPDFKTMGLSETVIFAQENELNLIIVKQYDDYVPQNSIISQSSAKDSVLHPEDDIRIVISLGKQAFMISFKSFSKEEAGSKASQLGVSYEITQRYSSSKKGRLIWQSIDEGTEIKPDMHLELRYSLGSKIFIDNFIGMKKSAIEQWLEKENALGARAAIGVTYTQNDAEPGTILQQSVYDTYIYRDKTINIVVSSGSIIYVPDFVAPTGAAYENAITRQKALDMVSSMNITLVFVEEATAGRLAGEVWHQSIAAGSEVSAGTTITLKYTPLGSTLEIPDFIGNTQAEVMAMPEYSKLLVTFVEGSYDIAFAGRVYSQSIAEHTTVAQGTLITLTVSPIIMVTVPDFSAMTREDVENSAHYNNFVITFTTGDSGDPADEDKVYQQSEAPFSSVAKDTTILLTLGTGS